MKTIELLIAHELDEYPLGNAYTLASGLDVRCHDTEERDFFGETYASIIAFSGEPPEIEKLISRHARWVKNGYESYAKRSQQRYNRFG